MNDLQVFENSEFGRLEVYEINGKPHFPATKCAEILGYEKPHNAVAMHCRYSLRQGVPHPQNPDKVLEINLIPEGDLYRLIIRSNMPKAQEFERWVFDVVLPQIRQTGTYNLIPKTFPEALRAYADEVERRQALEAENLKMLPKAEFHDRVTASEGVMTMEAAAKELGTGRNRLFRDLREKKILKSNNLPMQEYLDRGYFRVVQNPLRFGGEDKPYAQTMVTGKGLAYLSRLLIAR